MNTPPGFPRWTLFNNDILSRCVMMSQYDSGLQVSALRLSITFILEIWSDDDRLRLSSSFENVSFFDISSSNSSSSDNSSFDDPPTSSEMKSRIHEGGDIFFS